MENQKDIESEKNEKDFKKDIISFDVFLRTKADKLVSAVYMVSNFFPQEDPLRVEIRTKCLLLLSFINDLGSDGFYDKEKQFSKARNALSAASSLFQIAHHAGFVSVMNFTILEKEFIILDEMLSSEDARISIAANSTLPKNLFESLSRPYAAPTPMSINPSFHPPQQTSTTALPIKDTPVYSIPPRTQKPKENLQPTESKNTRRDMILELFRKNKGEALMIKDVSLVVKDCSEKTIQRELLDLVKNNVLKKEGERRWSKYSLSV